MFVFNGYFIKTHKNRVPESGYNTPPTILDPMLDFQHRTLYYHTRGAPEQMKTSLLCKKKSHVRDVNKLI